MAQSNRLMLTPASVFKFSPGILARKIFEAGVKAADPELAVRNAIQVQGKQISIDCHTQHGYSLRSKAWSKIHIIAFGKAACGMATAAADIISPDLIASDGIIVTNVENKQKNNHFDVYLAGHPVPDEHSLLAAQRVVSRVQQAQPGELLLVLISGGGSALIAYPSPGIALQDKVKTTQLLLGSGATINEINCVRKHLSRVKGGLLARLAYPVELHALVLSDVIGDDLSSIASGPTFADATTFEDAVNVLIMHKIWEQVPEDVRTHLLAGCDGHIQETPKQDDQIFDTTGYTLIGSNHISVTAMQVTAQQAGFEAEVYSTQLCGEAREEAVRLCSYAEHKLARITRPTAIIAGGETTVTIAGNGLGGRNQELALAFAINAERSGLSPRWLLLSAGTDGRDGPTDAAGAIVDCGTIARIRACGENPEDYLYNNDSYHALKLADKLLVTGSTGTNVADLLVLLLYPAKISH